MEIKFLNFDTYWLKILEIGQKHITSNQTKSQSIKWETEELDFNRAKTSDLQAILAKY